METCGQSGPERVEVACLENKTVLQMNHITKIFLIFPVKITKTHLELYPVC